MTPDLRKTLIFVAAALVMTGAAYFSTIDRSIRPEAFNDQGQKFFDDFDPNAATTLEVIEIDPDTLTPMPFKVTLQERPVGHPVALRLPRRRQETPRRHRHRDRRPDQGLDPLRPDRGPGSLRRGRPARHQGHRPQGVRQARDPEGCLGQGPGRLPDRQGGQGSPRPALRPRPRPEADLRRQRQGGPLDPVRRLDRDEPPQARSQQGPPDRDRPQDLRPHHRPVVPGEVVTLARADAAAPWVVEGTPPGKETNTETTTALTTALGDLKIAGIRPKPEGLTADLKQATGEIKPTTRQAMLSLVGKGFYPTREGFFSNKGEVTISTDEGVVYTLRYGEVVVAAGNELSAGTDNQTEAEKEANKKDPLKARQETSEGRYLFATAAFDPSLIPPPKPSTDPDDKLPDDPFAYDPDGSERQADPADSAGRGQAAKLQAETRPQGRRRPEAGQGTERPLRRLVLRHPRRQLPDDRPGSAQSDPRQGIEAATPPPAAEGASPACPTSPASAGSTPKADLS